MALGVIPYTLIGKFGGDSQSVHRIEVARHFEQRLADSVHCYVARNLSGCGSSHSVRYDQKAAPFANWVRCHFRAKPDIAARKIGNQKSVFIAAALSSDIGAGKD